MYSKAPYTATKFDRCKWNKAVSFVVVFGSMVYFSAALFSCYAVCRQTVCTFICCSLSSVNLMFILQSIHKDLLTVEKMYKNCGNRP